MSELYDTKPFAHVGDNEQHDELSSNEELDKIKNIKKEELPSSDEVEESSASVVGQMLPQTNLSESDKPDVDTVISDIKEDDEFDLLKESLNDIINGGEIYFEASKFIETLKDKIKKDDVTGTKKIDHGKVMKAAKAYTDMRMATSRIKIAVAKDSKIKGTSDYKSLQKKAIIAEKEFRKLKKELSKEELVPLNDYISGFDSTFNKKLEMQIADIRDAKRSSIKKESVDIITEKTIDDDMKPIIEKLNKKGYKTLSSSSGNNTLVAKDDDTKNGVRDGRLYSDARLVFKGKYNLGKAPEYWYWKKVDNADEVEYLDIKEIKYDTTPGGPSKAFQDWKIKYMKSLTDWVDSLPDISDKSEETATESSYEESICDIDTLFESVMGDLEFDTLIL